MKSIVGYPPNYEKICNHIPSVASQKGVVFTYGDTIYNPYDGEIQDHLEVHESIHERQQSGIGAEAWWDRYLVDEKFRLEQELEAYREQYRFVYKHYGRGVATHFLREIATDLSGGIYGNMLDRKQARKMILDK